MAIFCVFEHISVFLRGKSARFCEKEARFSDLFNVFHIDK
jgi:hypothetical protein